ncbi:MAG: D-alanyl-D-alanine carboxypeptidase, partial [Planctomycetota bacterium]|nr:D-alanyl-D-alanine carboxypeptidase [Planctomycetota bacterium]
MFSSISFLLLLLPSVAQQSADELVGSVDREKAIEVSALVKKLDGEVLFDYRAQRPLVLASNTKLFTTAAAALELGVDYRWHTKSYRDGNDLVIVGGGDPSMLTLDGTDYAQAFMVELLQSLRAQNLSTIDKLYIDGSAFSEQRHSLWPLEHKWDVFCAPPTALCVNASSISVNFNGKNTTYYPNVESSLKIAHYGKPGKYLSAWWANDGETLWVREPLKKADPASYAVADGLQFFGWWIHDSLQDSGISVKQVVLGKPPELFEYNLILDYESALSLERVLDEINKESNNLMAEMVLKTLANEAKLDGSYSNGVSEVERILKPLVGGIENLEQLDGSGMARSNVVNNSASPELI